MRWFTIVALIESLPPTVYEKQWCDSLVVAALWDSVSGFVEHIYLLHC